jgi:hypothetical protein
VDSSSGGLSFGIDAIVSGTVLLGVVAHPHRIFNIRGISSVSGRKEQHASFPLMTSSPPLLGYCPTCEREISQAWKLIEYEQADGSLGVFAECPSCEKVVKPQ